MPLEKQVVAIPLNQGMDTYADPKTIPPGKLVNLENVVFSGRSEMQARDGYNAAKLVSTTTTPAAPALGVAAYGDELVQLSNGQLYSYDSVNNQWSDKGPLVPVNVTEQGVSFANTISPQYADCAELSGIECHAYSDANGDLYATLIERSTGRSVVVDLAVNTGSLVRLIGVASAFGRFVVSWRLNSDGSVNARSITTAGALGSIVAISTGDQESILQVSTMFAFSTTRLYFTYLTNTGTIKTIYATGLSLATLAHSTFTPSASWRAVAGLACASGKVWLVGVYNSGTTKLEAVLYSSAGSVLTALATFYDFTTLYSGTTPAVSTCENPAITDGLAAVFSNGVALRAYVGGSIKTVAYTVALASEPFAYNGAVYVWGSYSDTAKLQSKLLLFDVNGRVWARALDTTSKGGSVASSVLVSGQTTKFLTCGISTGLSRIEANMMPVAACKPHRHGRTLAIPSSIVHQYDGSAVDEYGFINYPEITGTATAGGGSLSAGVYQVVAVYEWVDDRGLIYRSTPSLPVSVSVTSGQVITCTVRNLTVTNRQGTARQPVIAFYRTLANQPNLYFEGSVTNVTNSETQTFVVTASDTTVQSNLKLYTTGDFDSGIQPLEHSAPPSCVALETYRGRLAAASGARVYLSTLHLQNEPAEFAAEVYTNLPQEGGDVTALAMLDDKLVIFKETSIYVLIGDGPDNNGNNSDWREPQRIASQVGAIDQRSVVVTDIGVFFGTRRGLYLLDRSLQTSYVGRPVDTYNARTITSAVVCPRDRQVRFTIGASPFDPTLCFDYMNQQWGTFPSQGAVGSCYWNDRHVYQQSTAKVWIQTTSTSYWDTDTDGTTRYPIQMALQTGWMTFAALQGCMRLYKLLPLGTYISAHKLNVWVGYDYNETDWDETSLFDATSIIATDPKQTYQFGIAVKQQKCQAFRVYLQTQQTVAAGQCTLSALSFYVGVKPGSAKVRAGKIQGMP